MGAWLISFLFAVGASTWIYTKLQRYSGNNTKQSVMAAAAVGIFLFFVAGMILSLMFD